MLAAAVKLLLRPEKISHVGEAAEVERAERDVHLAESVVDLLCDVAASNSYSALVTQTEGPTRDRNGALKGGHENDEVSPALFCDTSSSEITVIEETPIKSRSLEVAPPTNLLYYSGTHKAIFCKIHAQDVVDHVIVEMGHVNLAIAKAGTPGPAARFNPSRFLQKTRKAMLTDFSMEEINETLSLIVTAAFFTLTAIFEPLDAGNKNVIKLADSF
ncbi:hypothetical protein CMQ_5228 [Grosmannia clavigera kw1407]|uniref:Uncharacterized protein n=1 Tax=Grosmannia clavigera (strain kw1407 / UAMH 11150) TaxID=655863 RepID=F0XBS4_GROCL|nr:uncharacterized protein CMQ_5228 [Grosmannia clavigera kw1407]EFX04966.1 hypothetical protein CMQ_5228 [Grosmannia clavigera kw1407]